MGTVEIRLNEGWVEVCDQGWDDRDARVLCHDMGFQDGVAMCCSKLGVDQSDSSPNKAFTQFKCLGHEQNLFQCPNTTLRTKCASEHRASAICYHKPQSQVDMGKPRRLRINAFKVACKTSPSNFSKNVWIAPDSKFLFGFIANTMSEEVRN